MLEEISGLLAQKNVSIARMEQSVQSNSDGSATLVIETHAALESALASTVKQLAESDVVEKVDSVLRVEGGE